MGIKITMEELNEILPEIAWIKDPDLRSAVAEIWLEIAEEMGWESLGEVPKNLREESNRPLIQHIRGVCHMAVALCESAYQIHKKEFDKDLLVAACLLHDVSKLVEYEPDSEKTKNEGGLKPGRKSEIGRNLPHAVYATHKVLAKDLSTELANLVVTHTLNCGVRGMTWEAAALFYADYADTDVGLDDAGARLYLQRWKLQK